MTNNEDVRKGNMILIDTDGLPVLIIDVTENAVLLESFPVNSFRLKKHIYGVPLTTGMLLDLGFNDDKTKHTWCGKGVTIHLKDNIFYGLRLTKNKTKIQYLHQLQNYITDYHLRFNDQKTSNQFTNDNLHYQ